MTPQEHVRILLSLIGNHADPGQTITVIVGGDTLSLEVGSALEAKHFMRCNTCGQPFDMRDLEAVLHHEQPGHEPVPGNA